MPRSLFARIVALTAAAIALGFLIAVGVKLWQAPAPAIAVQDKGVSGAALVGGAFTLTDQHGKRVADADFRGRFMLVYFGYSFCPDVCPTDLAAMAAAIDRLGPDADQEIGQAGIQCRILSLQQRFKIDSAGVAVPFDQPDA